MYYNLFEQYNLKSNKQLVSSIKVGIVLIVGCLLARLVRKKFGNNDANRVSYSILGGRPFLTYPICNTSP